MAAGIPLTHPALGDVTFQAVDDRHAAALGALGWSPEGSNAHPETVDEVVARVNGDPHRAAQALAVEQAHPHPRKTLVEQLSAITETSPED